MRNCFFIIITITAIASCKTSPGSNRNYDKFDPNKTYKLQLNPQAGTTYHYDIVNESASELEVKEETMKNSNKNEAGIIFKANRDTAGVLMLTMQYDRIHLYSKTGDKETEMDADKAEFSPDPTERILGLLKGAKLTTHLDEKGEIIYIDGYRELGDQIIDKFSPSDVSGRAIAEAQWERQFGEKFVKNNINQLFKIFPDSSVHIGDEWRLTTKQEGELPMTVKSSYRLKAINDDIAIISSKGTIVSDNTQSDIMGMSGVNAELQGEQEGEFEMETKTGMLIGCTMKAKVSGIIKVVGREIPVTIKTSVKVTGRRM